MNPLPVLNYHGVEERCGEYAWQPSERSYVVPLERLEDQIDYLVAQGFSTLRLGDIREQIEERGATEKPVVLTFDDGHQSHAEHVAPLFLKKRTHAIFFISAGLVGKNELMTWEQIRDLVKAGFEIGSHGFSHVPLSNLKHHHLWKEMQKSKLLLEDRLGVEVKSFSVPRGYYQLRMREVALELGYRYLFTSQFDLNSKRSDPLCLNRLAIRGDHSLRYFSRLVHGRIGPERWMGRMKAAARRFLKPSFYDALSDFKRRLRHA